MPQGRSVSSCDARLLLVDDDPSAIQVMGRILSQYPNQRFATSGEVALRLAHDVTPDLILLDADMPGMTGFDVCEALKTDPHLARVPVIFVTSHDTPALKVAALEKGAADFITKARIEVTGDAKEVAIAVHDSGMGIDAVQRQHLFEPFNRLGRQQVASGSGLGLVITRQLVEAMHGQLRVDSEPGQGSCFTITLPGGHHE
jgi:CheY-like chemotaxis protein